MYIYVLKCISWFLYTQGIFCWYRLFCSLFFYVVSLSNSYPIYATLLFFKVKSISRFINFDVHDRLKATSSIMLSVWSSKLQHRHQHRGRILKSILSSLSIQKGNFQRPPSLGIYNRLNIQSTQVLRAERSRDWGATAWLRPLWLSWIYLSNAFRC